MKKQVKPSQQLFCLFFQEIHTQCVLFPNIFLDIFEVSQTFLGSVWDSCLADLVKDAMTTADGTHSTTADTTRLLAKTKKTFT